MKLNLNPMKSFAEIAPNMSGQTGKETVQMSALQTEDPNCISAVSTDRAALKQDRGLFGRGGPADQTPPPPPTPSGPNRPLCLR